MSAFDLARHVTEALPARLAKNLALAPLSGRFVVVIEADEGAWSLRIEGASVEVVDAVTPIDATLRAHRLDWIDLFEGVASVKAALVDGRLELEGDVALAARVCGALFD